MSAYYLAPDPCQSTFLIPGSNVPGNGVQVFTYAAGTTTKVSVAKDVDGSALHTNPIVLDSGGNLPSASSMYLPVGTLLDIVYAPSDDTDPPASSYKTIQNIQAPVGDAANVNFIAAGTGAVSTTAQAKMRERVSVRDYGSTGDGVADDRSAWQLAVNAVSTNGGTVLGIPGDTYLVSVLASSTKSFGDLTASYALEIPDNVFIDLQGATIKGDDDVEYTIVSNINTTNTANGNSNLGIFNGIIDCNQVTRSTDITPCGLGFWGVRGLKMDRIKVINAYGLAIDLEACDEFDIGTMEFVSTYGAAFYMGGQSQTHGAGCSNGSVKQVTCYHTLEHDFSTIPGNPVLCSESDHVTFGQIISHDADAAFKYVGCSDVQIGRALYEDGNTANSGLKLQGSAGLENARFTVGDVLSRNCQGSGLYIAFTDGVTIDSYYGNSNGLNGINADITQAGGDVRIGKCVSENAGISALLQYTANATLYTGQPSAQIDDLDILNAFQVSTTGSPTAVSVTNGLLKIGKCKIRDLTSSATLLRYFDTGRNKESGIWVDEFYGRGATGNPNTGGMDGSYNVWIGRPDVSRLTFPGDILTMSSAAVSTSVWMRVTSGPFVSTDVGLLVKGASSASYGLSEITAYTDTSTVTVANRIAWSNTSLAAGLWYIDRGHGGWKNVTLAAAVSTAVTDESFVNLNGNALLSFVPTNAAAVTLGLIKGYSWSGSTLTLNHSSAAGTETYQYRILGWQWE